MNGDKPRRKNSEDSSNKSEKSDNPPLKEISKIE